MPYFTIIAIPLTGYCQMILQDLVLSKTFKKMRKDSSSSLLFIYLFIVNRCFWFTKSFPSSHLLTIFLIFKLVLTQNRLFQRSFTTSIRVMVVLTWRYSPSLAWMTVNFVLLPRISPQAPHFLNSSSVNFFSQWSSLADFTSNANVNNDPWNSESTKGGEHVQWWKNINSVSFMTSLTQLKRKRSGYQPQATAGEKT